LLSDSPENNVTEAIASKVGRNLHNRTHHPICTIKNIITTHFTSLNQNFEFFDDLCPVVDTKNNFDDLLVKPDHVSRRMSDTYYISRDTVLRTHTSAHQTSLLSQGSTAFLATGDVYRRDEIDSSHYPVFHQMEGVRVFSDDEVHHWQFVILASNIRRPRYTLTLLAKKQFKWLENT
jgi:phenylalanyl-tRNA synthetase alpha chain